MRFWSYQGCTDGCCEGRLCLFEKGFEYEVGCWDADIGMRSAMAAFELSKGSNVDAILTLTDRVGIAVKDGWGEYEGEHLWEAGRCSVLAAQAARMHTDMLDSKKVSAALQSIAASMEVISKDLRRFKAMDAKSINEIDWLLATIESLDIALAAKPCKSAKKRAVRI